MFRFLCLLAVVSLADASASADIRITADVQRPPIALQRAQWTIQLDRTYDNPFDPDEIAVDVKFVGPDARELIVPAFWYVPGRSESKPPSRATTAEQIAQSSFVVRFTPPTSGAWTATVSAKDSVGVSRSRPISFDVKTAATDARGFVRRSATSSRYLQFDSGGAFFPIGPNIGWAGERGVAQFDEWFAKLAGNGGNFARIWMSRPNQLFETKRLGVDRYDADGSAFYDALLEAAETRGVYCMLTFNNYRDLIDRDMWGEAEWRNLPHNAANGGPCTRPIDFIASSIGQKLYRNRLRYIVARWSAYTSVACWEFWNEQTFTKLDIPPAWTRDMARHLKSIDPHRHLVSTSFGANSQHEVWAMDEIDIAQEHIYPGSVVRDATLPLSTMTHALRAKFDKPNLIAEFGIAPEASDISFDADGVGTNMHNGMWATMLSGSAGAGAMWWWDNYIDPKNLWSQYRGVSSFARQIDWVHRRFEPIKLAPVMSAAGQPETFTDLVVRSGGGWGRSHGQPIAIAPNGETSVGLPQFIYGTEKAELRTPTVLNVELPTATTMVVRVAKVSDAAVLRIVIDGEPRRDFAFSGLPGAPGQTKVEKHPEGVWQAEFHQDCGIDVPAGKHAIEIRNQGNDWLAIETVTFRAARSSRYAPIETLALQDERAGDLIAWLHDTESNWFNDRAKLPPRTVEGATLDLVVDPDETCRVQWFDTWGGQPHATRQVTASASGELKLEIPPLRRDIALRVTRRVGS